MTIYTQFYTPVTIVGARLNEDNQLVLNVIRHSGGIQSNFTPQEYHVSHFKADRGLAEIMENPHVAKLFS